MAARRPYNLKMVALHIAWELQLEHEYDDRFFKKEKPSATVSDMTFRYSIHVIFGQDQWLLSTIFLSTLGLENIIGYRTV